eukprot:TRINITY_DN7877_c0_g1_i1.p2 TRINITY_DN7877_c0_g1~~TRINITY_DN7877_c0_g1_i1.p2  ORF type:complete len:224 (+),score=62.93 TRINITY_DN7877_c0_g1_i1:110-781(+)
MEAAAVLVRTHHARSALGERLRALGHDVREAPALDCDATFKQAAFRIVQLLGAPSSCEEAEREAAECERFCARHARGRGWVLVAVDLGSRAAAARFAALQAACAAPLVPALVPCPSVAACADAVAAFARADASRGQGDGDGGERGDCFESALGGVPGIDARSVTRQARRRGCSAHHRKQLVEAGFVSLRAVAEAAAQSPPRALERAVGAHAARALASFLASRR